MVKSRDWLTEYEKAGAIWRYDGDPKKPHALLTSGLHSTGFFNSIKITEVPFLLNEAAEELVELLIESGCDLMSFDVVAGPETGATKMAEFVAFQIGMHRHRICHFISPIKEDGAMRLGARDKATVKDKRVILCDDTLTTGSSVRFAEDCIRDAEGTVIEGHILTIANRTGSDTLNGRRVTALITQPFPTWTAAECPHCAAGSVALKPKQGANWDLFIGATNS